MSSRRIMPADSHVHSEWSWDAPAGSMFGSCERAQQLGLPAVVFTEHADFTMWAYPEEPTVVDGQPVVAERIPTGVPAVADYLDCLDRCRVRFPDLTILSGVEVGEAHIFPDQARELLDAAPFDRVLGSVHTLEFNGVRLYAPVLTARADDPSEVVRRYLAEVLRLVESCDAFEVLAHIDYAVRIWPDRAGPYRVGDFEEEHRAALRELARSGRVLEVNTTLEPDRRATGTVVRWWYEEGGGAMSFGSDAHEPHMVGRHFSEAAAMAEQCGFRAGRHPVDFWRR